mmetsp:Transcript_25426/g.57909  ORF Transcript_25426/g.57909 Transcript_25426/m.57909 type:complete len:206 (+) Transcript_25426:438-1055(+)
MISKVERLLRVVHRACESVLQWVAFLDHVPADRDYLLLLDLTRGLLHRELVVDDLEAPFESPLHGLHVRVLLARHLGEPPLAVEDGSSHTLIKPILEDILGDWAAEPGIDEALGLSITLHHRYWVPWLAWSGPAVQVEVRHSIWRWLGLSLLGLGKRAPASWHLWPPLAAAHDIWMACPAGQARRRRSLGGERCADLQSGRERYV